MKRFILFFAAVFIVTAALAPGAYAADGDFTVDAKGVITKYGGWDTAVVIPATIGGKKITAIGKEAFKNAGLTHVTIPAGITEIGEYAFENNKLTGITIPGTVKSLGYRAFGGNNGIATIVLSEGVVYDNGAFTRDTGGAVSASDVRADVTVTLPSSISRVSSNFGQNATLILGANINAAFYGYESYIANDRKAGTYTPASRIVSEKRTSEYDYIATPYGAILKSYNGNETRVRIPAEIGGLPVKALYAPYSEEVVSIFYGKKVDAVQIPESVTYIGANAFAGQPFTSVTLPAGLTYIGDGAFDGMVQDYWRMLSPRAEGKLTAVTIPAGVTYIGARAFAGNPLASVTIPSSVTYIGNGAFSNCYNLTTVTISGNVTFGGDVFSGCPKLNTATKGRLVTAGYTGNF